LIHFYKRFEKCVGMFYEKLRNSTIYEGRLHLFGLIHVVVFVETGHVCAEVENWSSLIITPEKWPG